MQQLISLCHVFPMCPLLIGQNSLRESHSSDAKGNFNPSPDNKILASSKLKAFADNKVIYYSKLLIGVPQGRKHSGKRRKPCLPAIFFFSHNVFKKASSLGASKVITVW